MSYPPQRLAVLPLTHSYFYLFQVDAEHAEHVQSVKQALESTNKNLEEMKLGAAKEHEGKLLIFFLTND